MSIIRWGRVIESKKDKRHWNLLFAAPNVGKAHSFLAQGG
jgi:hypothetical protein